MEILKISWNCEIWWNLCNLVEIVNFGGNCEFWWKLWNLVDIVKFGRNCEIWSTQIVFSKCVCHCHCCCLCLSHCLFDGQVTFSHHSDQMSQRSQVSCMDLYSDYVWTAKNISGSCFLYIIVFSMCALRNGVSPLLEQWKDHRCVNKSNRLQLSRRVMSHQVNPSRLFIMF